VVSNGGLRPFAEPTGRNGDFVPTAPTSSDIWIADSAAAWRCGGHGRYPLAAALRRRGARVLKHQRRRALTSANIVNVLANPRSDEPIAGAADFRFRSRAVQKGFYKGRPLPFFLESARSGELRAVTT